MPIEANDKGVKASASGCEALFGCAAIVIVVPFALLAIVAVLMWQFILPVLGILWLLGK